MPTSSRLAKIFAITTVALSLALVGQAAFAASPVKGGTYGGSLKLSSALTVSFRVSASGKKVVGMKVEPMIPNRCGSGGDTPPPEISKPAPIKGGKFSVLIKEELENGLVSGTATVTGKFLPGGKEKGIVKVPIPGAPECAGNFPYTARAAKK